MVAVFIWMPKSKDGTSDIGHGAMQVNSHYISNWPGELKSLLYGKGYAQLSFDDDKRAERGMPTLIYLLKGLDEEAMEKKWKAMKPNLKYSFPTYNCFTTVADVLHEGIGGLKETAIEIGTPHNIIVAHPLLISYCEMIKLAYDGQKIVPLKEG